MKQIKYSPDAADKLRAINRGILLQYGSQKAKAIIGRITGTIRGLKDNEEIGPSVEEMLSVPCNYRYLFVAKNYVFYRVEEDCIRIINIYHERGDFMWLLFGIDTTPQETNDYWGEE